MSGLSRSGACEYVESIDERGRRESPGKDVEQELDWMFDELDWAGRVPKMSEAGGSFLVGAVASISLPELQCWAAA